MDELIVLIFRGIVALVEGAGKKRASKVTPSDVSVAAQKAAWERQRQAWEVQQKLQRNKQQLPAAANFRMKKTAGVRPPRPGRVTPPPLFAAKGSPVAQRRVAAPTVANVVPLVGSSPAAAVARSVRPKTLRNQFILAEVLKPPLSLR